MNTEEKDRDVILDRRLAGIAGTPGAETAGLSVVILRDDRIVHTFFSGRRHIAASAADADLPIEADTKFRIASISKPVVGIVAVALSESGKLDLERDVSDYLGFKLRNPSFPEVPITCAMLLSHTSSLRDGEVYSLPMGSSFREFFEPGNPAYESGGHFAKPLPGKDLSPGNYFSYCNLGFGVVGTVLEFVSGMRFDLLMREFIFEPLGMDASFNVSILSDLGFSRLGSSYRKARDGVWDPACPWVPQIDDYLGKKPRMSFSVLPGLGEGSLDSYVPGTNGTLFSPQGGLRVSIMDQAKVLRLLMNGGSVDGVRILSPQGVRMMTTPRWTFDPEWVNGEISVGLTRSTGLALIRNTGASDGFGGDRLLPGGSPALWGHHGDAYGFLGGMMFHPEKRYGYLYFINGTAAEPEKRLGRHSSFFLWEEEIQEAVLGWLGES